MVWKPGGDEGRPLDVEEARSQFPILKRNISEGRPLVYLDNAATTQKPQAVIDAMSHYYETMNSNVHRTAHTLASEATAAYEEARGLLKDWFGASSSRMVFTSGTTEAINLAAHSWARANLSRGDVIVLTEMEHHADIVPWQLMSKEMGVHIRWVPFDLETLELDMEILQASLDGARLIGVVHTSNVLGVRNDIERIVSLAHGVGAKVLVDAAQAAPHDRLGFEDLGADMMAISAHKMGGPTGIGALMINEQTFSEMVPFMGGGDMIREVHLDHSTYQENEHRLEAGTPRIAEVIGWAAAVRWLSQWDVSSIHEHGLFLARMAADGLRSIDGMRVFARLGDEDGSLVSFLHDGMHANDMAAMLDARGIAVRTGHHCAQPLLRRFDVAATNRASFWLYNTEDEVAFFIDSVQDLCRRFG